MNEYLPLVKILNGIEKEDMDTLAKVDSYPLVNHRSKIIGITGPQGAGKSTFLADMTKMLLKDGHKIAVLLIDPSDPYTHGAFLGDRIRFSNLPIHRNLFIRSVATRGFLGGTTLYTPLFIKAFVQYGFQIIFVETVGTGQNEVDIYQVADVNLYITSPDIGDTMQVLKGGSMNNFDIILINKQDLSGADRAEILIRKNSNLLNSKKQLRIIKHQKGKHRSLQKVYNHILELFKWDEIMIKREELVRYYHKKIFMNLIEENLNSIIKQDINSNGESIIENALLAFEKMIKGEDSFDKRN